MKRHLIGILLFISILAGWVFFFPPNPLTSDQKMIDHFERNRQSFEKLAGLASADAELTSLDRQTVVLNGRYLKRAEVTGDLSPVRLDQYQALMDELDVRRLDRPSTGGGAIHFETDSIAVSELDYLESIVISKDYVYSPWQPSPLSDSLDDKNFETSVNCYKKIDGTWYLYFDSGISKPE